MAPSIQKPQIPRRDRITVSPERRAEARAGMGGEQVKTADAPATAPSAPVVEAPPSPPVVEVPVATVTPDVMPASTTEVEAPPAPPEPAPRPVPVAVPVAVATAPAAPHRRGRKPAAPDAVLMEPERSVKIPESVWDDIRLALVLLPKGEDLPTSIKSYLVAAHRHYQAQLRKQGKLPAGK